MLTHIILSRYNVSFLRQNQFDILTEENHGRVIICSDKQMMIGLVIICRSYECLVVVWRSDEGEVLVRSQAVVVFVLFKELSQTLQVNPVQTVNILTAGTGGLDN